MSLGQEKLATQSQHQDKDSPAMTSYPDDVGMLLQRRCRLSSINDLDEGGISARTTRLMGVMILLLGCFVISVGVAVLVYFLLLEDVTTIKVSIPIYNRTFSPAMMHSSSYEFQTIAEPLCKEMMMHIEKEYQTENSVFCSVIGIRNLPNPKTCFCSSVRSYRRRNILQADLFLSTSSGISPADVLRLIEKNSKTLLWKAFELVYLGEFIIDFNIKPSIDPCADSPCANGGSCQTIGNQVKCTCKEGWEGDRCKIDINTCLENPCLNEGECHERLGEDSCICRSGWTGRYCEQDKDECISSPCKNGAECQNTIGSYSCTCLPGWVGDECQNDLDECAASPCHGQSSCINYPGSFSCECPPERTGTKCEIAKDLHICDAITCFNNGTCKETLEGASCLCETGWHGDRCERDVDECLTRPCRHDSTCENIPGSFFCICREGWSGPLCEKDMDECHLTPCGNNGTCHNMKGTFRCECSNGWEGNTCNIDINECDNLPCFNDGVCQNSPGSFKCECGPGWIGDLCNKDIDECQFFTCMNNGTCYNYLGTYSCDCTSGWNGELCEVDVDECIAEDPCMHNSTCQNLPGSFSCDCLKGWTGDTCNKDIDECLSTPCLNNGTCQNTFGGFNCACPEGWHGKYCHIDVNECHVTPCLNNASCVNIPGSYTCTCDQGWTGKYCELDFVSTNLTFKVLNWNDSLEESSPKVFQSYSSKFCQEVSDILLRKIPSILSCAIESFRRDPARLTVTLNTKERYSESVLRDIILRNTKTFPYLNKMANLIGDLFVESGSIYHDGWLTNVTMNIYKFSYKPTFSNNTSDDFKRLERRFCRDIDSFFSSSSHSNKYFRCYIEHIGIKDPYTLTFAVVFNSTDFVSREVILDVISFHAQHVNIDNYNLMMIGGQFLYTHPTFNAVAVNVSDFRHNKNVFENVKSRTSINITATLRNFTFYPELADPASSALRNLSEEFCSYLTRILSTRPLFEDIYMSCKINHFSPFKNMSTVSFQIRFKGIHDKTLREYVYGILLENAPRIVIDGEILIKVGPLFISDESLTNGSDLSISRIQVNTGASVTETSAKDYSTGRATLNAQEITTSKSMDTNETRTYIPDISTNDLNVKSFQDQSTSSILSSLTFLTTSRQELTSPKLFTLEDQQSFVKKTTLSNHSVLSDQSTLSDETTLSGQSISSDQSTLPYKSTSPGESNYLEKSTLISVASSTSGSSSTIEPDPCKPDKHNVFLPVNSECHMFFRCIHGDSYKFQCAGNTVFYPKLNLCDFNDGSVKCNRQN